MKFYRNFGVSNAPLGEGYDYGDDDWVKVVSKSVYDSDGFTTDYTWYKSKDGKLHIFMFGDSDIYTPDRDYADWETESEQEASDWFDAYGDEYDDDDDFYEDFENLPSWKLSYTVNGQRSSQTLKAQSASAAQSFVRSQYGGQTVTFVETHKVEESLTKVTEDAVDDNVAGLDTFVSQMGQHSADNLTEVPPVDSGIASMLNSLIQDEWQTIDAYTSAIQTLQSENAHPEMIPTLNDIIAEENRHVGQLQLLMGIVSPSTTNIDKGEEEAVTQVEESQPDGVALSAMQNFENIASEVVDVADDLN